MRFGLSFCLIQRSPQLELDYFLCFLMRYLSSIDITKLTIAPRAANIIVFKTSSECRFGKILKNVPPTVPIRVWLLLVILAWGQCRFPCGQLAHCRDHSARNGHITTNSSQHDWQSYWSCQDRSTNGSHRQSNISKHFKKFRGWSFRSFYNIHLFSFFVIPSQEGTVIPLCHSRLSFPCKRERESFLSVIPSEEGINNQFYTFSLIQSFINQIFQLSKSFSRHQTQSGS